MSTTTSLTAARIRKMPKKAYMNDEQLAYFRQKLQEIKADCQARLESAKVANASHDRCSDPIDFASQTEERDGIRRQQARDTQRIRDVNAALKRIAEGEYGYCSETGDEIGIGRMLANPLAAMSVEACETAERRTSLYRAAA